MTNPTDWTRRTMIVPDAQVTYARELSAAVAGPAGDGMYTTPLSATGQEPATHWISAGLISEEFAALLPFAGYREFNEIDPSPGNAAQVAEIATANGYPTTAEQVQALFDASEVTDEEAHEVMAWIGLQMVTDGEVSVI